MFNVIMKFQCQTAPILLPHRCHSIEYGFELNFWLVLYLSREKKCIKCICVKMTSRDTHVYHVKEAQFGSVNTNLYCPILVTVCNNQTRKHSKDLFLMNSFHRRTIPFIDYLRISILKSLCPHQVRSINYRKHITFQPWILNERKRLSGSQTITLYWWIRLNPKHWDSVKRKKKTIRKANWVLCRESIRIEIWFNRYLALLPNPQTNTNVSLAPLFAQSQKCS